MKWWAGSCVRKVRFSTRKEANKHIQQLRQSKRLKNQVRVYWCDCCQGYHFRSKKRSVGTVR